MAAPADFLSYVDSHKDGFIKRLATAVEIPRYVLCRWLSTDLHSTLGKRCSVSGDPARREDVFRMGDFLESELKAYGVETKRVELGTQVLEGKEIKLPPLVLGRIGNDKSKKTILIYGHFDVQPVSIYFIT